MILDRESVFVCNVSHPVTREMFSTHPHGTRRFAAEWHLAALPSHLGRHSPIPTTFSSNYTSVTGTGLSQCPWVYGHANSQQAQVSNHGTLDLHLKKSAFFLRCHIAPKRGRAIRHSGYVAVAHLEFPNWYLVTGKTKTCATLGLEF